MKKKIPNKLAAELATRNIIARCIHGGVVRDDREQAFIDLTHGVFNILIGTDIVGRLLDLYDFTHIFNYDFPSNMEKYLYRIKSDKIVACVSLWEKEDGKHAEGIVRIMDEVMQEVPDWLRKEMKRYKVQQERKAHKESNSGLAFVPDRGGDICRRCGLSGHWSRECPVGPLVKGGGRVGRGVRVDRVAISPGSAQGK